jgi:hypothetical protein
MIAANYRKHPQAMALQLPLPFSRLLVWALKRPTTRTLRAIRAARAAAFKLAGRISYPVKPTIPQWFKDASRRAQVLAQAIKAACIFLNFEDDTVEQIDLFQTLTTDAPLTWPNDRIELWENNGHRAHAMRVKKKLAAKRHEKETSYDREQWSKETLTREELFTWPQGIWTCCGNGIHTTLSRAYLRGRDERAA